MALRSFFAFLALRMRFILLVSEFNSTLYCNNSNTSFVVKSMSHQGFGGIVQINVNVCAVDVNYKGDY